MAEFDLSGANEEEEIEREIEDCISRLVCRRFASGMYEFEDEDLKERDLRGNGSWFW